MKGPLSLGYSTCPNDTFIFYALAHGRIDLRGLSYRIVLADVEALNQEAAAGGLDITKLSYAAVGHLLDTYALLPCGGALGRGCGPLLIARPGADLGRIGKGPVAVPGAWTTACLLLNLFSPEPVEMVPVRFDHIMPAVQEGRFEMGVIIHEGRFTYPAYGLTCLMDLGKWWETRTGLPIPLGGIAVRRSLCGHMARNISESLCDSIRYARKNPGEAEAYIREHAQEMAPEIMARHIGLYVNDFTLNVGEEGRLAVETLFRLAAEKGWMKPVSSPLFAC
jgi:5,8-dihydroxy-2-naphthoate synthase